MRHEFPWDYVQGAGIAFMRDYGVPSIARLLDRTGEFEHDGVKRYDDTLLIGEEAGARRPRLTARARHGAPAEPDPRALRHPERRVRLRPRHHDRRAGPLDRRVRLAGPRPGRARGVRAVHHPLRRADGHPRSPHDVRGLPPAAARLRAGAVRVRPGQQAGRRGVAADRGRDHARGAAARRTPGGDLADGRAAAHGPRPAPAAGLAGARRTPGPAAAGRRAAVRPPAHRAEALRRARRTPTATPSPTSAPAPCSTPSTRPRPAARCTAASAARGTYDKTPRYSGGERRLPWSTR